MLYVSLTVATWTSNNVVPFPVRAAVESTTFRGVPSCVQAPSAHQVTHARLQRCTFALQQGFSRLQQDLEPLTRHQKLLQQRQQQQQQQQQGQKKREREAGQEADAGPGALQRVKLENGNGQAPGPGAVAAGADEVGAGSAAVNAAAAAAAAATRKAVYDITVDVNSPSLGTLRAPLAAPLPEVMAAAAATMGVSGGGGPGGVLVRRHLTDADRERWNKLDRILAHQFASLQRWVASCVCVWKSLKGPEAGWAAIMVVWCVWHRVLGFAVVGPYLRAVRAGPAVGAGKEFMYQSSSKAVTL